MNRVFTIRPDGKIPVELKDAKFAGDNNMENIFK